LKITTCPIFNPGFFIKHLRNIFIFIVYPPCNMKTISKRSLLFLILFFVVFCLRSQIAGSFTVPGSFPSIAAAVNTLNALGVAGPVTINIAAAYTETAPTGGLKLFNVAGVSAVNQIYFTKLGAGSNPLVYAYTGGTCTPLSTSQDGIWWLIGSDYITIDGIDLTDPNAANPATMEFGFGLYRLNAGDGCQNNTIRNCVITLRNVNGAASGNTVTMACGSRGIELSPTSYTQTNFVITPTVAGATNSNNKFFSNVVQNCHTGIALMGPAGGNNDIANDIGGLAAVTGNTIINFGGGSGSAAFGIRTINQYSLNLSYNALNNNNGSGADPLTALTAVQVGTVPATVNSVLNNTVSLSNALSNTITMDAIYCMSGGTTFINANRVSSYSFPTSGGTQFNMMYSLNSQSATIIGNSIENVTVNPSSCGFIYSNSAYATISSNTINNIFTSSGTELMLGTSGLYPTISGNLISNVICSNSNGSLTAIYFDAPSNASVLNNTVTNLQSRYVTGMESGTSGSGTQRLISGNQITNISNYPGAAGLSFNGMNIYHTTVNNATVNVSGNTIFSVTCNGTSTLSSTGNLAGMTFSAAYPCTVSANKIYGFSSVTAGTVQGISILNAMTPTLNNNLIGDFRISNSSQSIAIAAVAVYSNSSVQMNYNSIYLNNINNLGNNSGSAVLAFLNATGIFTLNNNIFINTSNATGTGSTCIIRRTATPLGQYASSSNRNLFFTGSVAPNRSIYFDGTNSYSTLFNFKTAVSPREAQSVTENPPFVTINGGAVNTLSINPAIATQVEGGAAPIASVTVDYAGTARNISTPDIGAWEGNYTQADEVAPVTLSSGFTGPPCNTSNRTFTANIKDTSGVATGSLAPRLYYKINFGLYSSVQGSLTVGTVSLGVWTFSLTYSTSPGDIIYYFLALQDQSFVNNLAIIPPTGANASDVNNIFIPPSPAYNYTIETYPTVSVSSGTVCYGQSYTLNPTGAFTYTYTGGGPIVTPTVNTSYSITGATAGGCISTNTAVADLTVVVSPTVTVNSGSICSGQTFTISPSGAVSYTYSGGSPLVSPTVTSFYAVVGSNSLGCTSNTAIVTVSVAYSTITGSASSNSVCSGNTIVLNGSGGTGYTWSGGVINNTVFTPVVSNIYTVSGISLNGCPGTATVQVTVFANPSLTIASISNAICIGQSLTLNAGGANTFTWYPGGNIGVTCLVGPITSTQYTLAGTDINGCTSYTSILITVNPLPTLSVNSSTTNICSGQTVTLTANGAASYTWNPGALTGSIVAVSPTVTTVFTLTGSDINFCENSYAQMISVDPCAGIWERNIDFPISIYPNPASDKLSIKTARFENIHIKINDGSGRLVLDEKVCGNCDLKLQLDRGVYIMRLYNEDQLLLQEKLLVE
jgi:hypothetical protein